MRKAAVFIAEIRLLRFDIFVYKWTMRHHNSAKGENWRITQNIRKSAHMALRYLVMASVDRGKSWFDDNTRQNTHKSNEDSSSGDHEYPQCYGKQLLRYQSVGVIKWPALQLYILSIAKQKQTNKKKTRWDNTELFFLLNSTSQQHHELFNTAQHMMITITCKASKHSGHPSELYVWCFVALSLMLLPTSQLNLPKSSHNLMGKKKKKHLMKKLHNWTGKWKQFQSKPNL